MLFLVHTTNMTFRHLSKDVFMRFLESFSVLKGFPKTCEFYRNHIKTSLLTCLNAIRGVCAKNNIQKSILAGINTRECPENSLVFYKSFDRDFLYRHEFVLLRCMELTYLFHLWPEWSFYDTACSYTKLCEIGHFRWKMKKSFFAERASGV